MDREWATRPKLDRLDLTVELGGRLVGSATATGRSSIKRKALWVYKEVRTEHDNRYTLIDHLHHLLLVAEQDRPTSLEALEQGLCGGQGWQPGFF